VVISLNAVYNSPVRRVSGRSISDRQDIGPLKLSMTCPECNAELDQSGACTSCGYRQPADVRTEAPEPPDTEPPPIQGSVGPIPLDYSDSGSRPDTEAETVPEWKKELSRRLQEIKQKRQQTALQSRSNSAAPAVEGVRPKLETTERPLPRQEPKPARPPRRSVPRVPKPSPPAARPTASDALPLFQAPGQTGTATDGTQQDLGSVIDSVIEKHLAEGKTPGAVARVEAPSPAPEERWPRIIVAHGAASEEELRREERMTLLSRTLSGLVDLVAIIGCAVAIIVSTDVVAGIAVMDTRSGVVYGALILAIYFLYTVYFLGTGTQTPGMMITGLRLIDEETGRPTLKQVVGRAAVYLVAMAPLGLGLLWGCFDARARCWQDRLSGTRVARL